jgi:hypothetical protein
MNAVYTGAGKVMRVPKSGGVPTVIAEGQAWPSYLATAGGVIFWTDRGQNAEGKVLEGSIEAVSPRVDAWAVRSDTCEPMGIAAVPASAGQVSVYWTAPQCSAIMTVDWPGGQPQTLVATWGAGAIAADDTNLYWISSNGGIATASRGGGASVDLAFGDCPTYGGGGSIALDAGSVYWLDDCGKVSKVAKSGGPSKCLGSKAYPGLDNYLAADETRLYWLDGDVVYMNKDGSGRGSISAPVGSTGVSWTSEFQGGIAVDADAVYWADFDGIWRAPMPTW